MLGRTRREFLGTPLEEFIYPDDNKRAVACFESALAGDAPATVELRFRMVTDTGSGSRAARHRSRPKTSSTAWSR
ncbi:PAS domain-containing protein [Halorubrum trueperi]